MSAVMPAWNQLMAPVLRVLLDGHVHPRRQLANAVAAAEQISDEQRGETLNSGQSRFDNRLGWATSALSRAGAIDRPTRGRYQITDAGRQLLGEHPNGIAEADLLTVSGESEALGVTTSEPSSDLDPTEQIEAGIARIQAEVADDLLSRLHAKEPAFFESAVVELLVAMGYGGAEGQATATRLSRDGGIDGIIDQDTLGLNKVYVQAKRYAPNNAVQRPELQAFVGALSGKADGGVFITTGRFSRGASEYAASIPSRIILIDGQRLTALMIRFGVGVQVKQTVQIVEVDEDFFE